ncbi:MAG: hypothetical protein Kow0092_23570 [Deferrisomatales bacterium]
MKAPRTLWILLALCAGLLWACSDHPPASPAAPPSDRPVARVTAEPTIGKVPLTVAFDATASLDPAGEGLSYAWAFDDGSTARGARVEHTFARVGTYAVTLTVTDARGRRDTAWAVIIVDRRGAAR